MEYGEHGEKITFDYLLQKVVENTAALDINEADDLGEVPAYKVSLGTEEKVVISSDHSDEERKIPAQPALAV